MLKTCFLRRIAGQPYELPNVATRRDVKGPIPKGPFGVLWDASPGSLKYVTRALNAMMIYSDLTAPVVTETQWKKFHSSVTRPLPSSEAVRLISDQIRVPGKMRVSKEVRLKKIEEFVVGKGYSPTFVRDHIELFIDSDSGQYLWNEYPQFKEVFNTIGHTVDTRIGMDDYFGYHEPLTFSRCVDPVGILGYTQEPGYKLRVFASPNIVYQCAMSRLKVQLFTLLQSVGWDCTYNQSSGTDWVKRQLDQGEVVWSIDLSDATNNFPLDLQLDVLQKIGVHPQDLRLFRDLSRLPWDVNQGRDSGTITWTVGQPLGLGPSFAAFALTHGLLVHACAQELASQDDFRVLGDDIVIRGDALASKYLQKLEILGIPISKDKTIRSRYAAEFAGKVVTRDGILAAVKWRDVSDHSFLDFVHNIGPSSMSLLRPRQQKVAKFISLLPEPTGFGWNPKGIPFSHRIAAELYFEETIPVRYETYRPIQKNWNKVTFSFRERCLQPSFHSCEWDPVVGKATENGSRTPRPGMSKLEYSLQISEDTGAPLKVPANEVTPQFKTQVKKRGFVTSSYITDPRGVSPLEDLEYKIAAAERRLTQDGISIPL